MIDEKLIGFEEAKTILANDTSPKESGKFFPA